MAFSVDNFIKNTAKTAVSKILDNVVGNIGIGLPTNSKLIAKNTAESLFNVGSSYESVSAFSSQRTDTIISESSSDFFAFAGKSINRASESGVSSVRRGIDNTKSYYMEINPETKVKRKKDQYEILSVL